MLNSAAGISSRVGLGCAAGGVGVAWIDAAACLSGGTAGVGAAVLDVCGAVGAASSAAGGVATVLPVTSARMSA